MYSGAQSKNMHENINVANYNDPAVAFTYIYERTKCL